MQHNAKGIQVPLNRVEGDLEVRIQIDNGVVSEAWCAGTMYRGFERIMVGRGALDGLVITPRVCGICTTGHLTAAARALDMVAGVEIPPAATRVRNLALMAEHLQSDVRHYALLFAADFTNPAYAGSPLYEEAVARYQPLKGSSTAQVLAETARVLEIVAILGGQWPHSSYMVPGGIATVFSQADLLQCRLTLGHYRQWFEQRVLGCTLERWAEVDSPQALETWLETAEHRQSELGFFLRFAGQAGLDRLGRWDGGMVSFGSLDLPAGSAALGAAGQGRLIPAGFLSPEGAPQAFDQARISEEVACSWFRDYPGGLHPCQGMTQPYAVGEEGPKYSWAKAPRYDGQPAETGPLAELLLAGHGLLTSLVAEKGASVFTRELARLIRPATLLPAMEAWLDEMAEDQLLYQPPGEISDGEGWGLTQASRGALGHWLRLEEGRIAHYQIITPTAWNASPRDGQGRRGPLEQALLGTPVPDPDNLVQVGHVVRSFDPCLVCAVHAWRAGDGARAVDGARRHLIRS